uniref:PNPLA domain-containing protein n=1 Tax=Periophthalmus magnuspinnatus TaxID=409849 RepID=A0A3B3ZL04_9GOBI
MFLETPVSISFSGSGFMATYQLGVAQCFLNYAPWILKSAPHVFGASAGSLVAAAVSKSCLNKIIEWLYLLLQAPKNTKTFHSQTKYQPIHILRKYVPEDAHKLACGRLAVAMTRLEDGQHIIMTEYHSKDDVALLCSCYVPVYCGMTPPSFKGMVSFPLLSNTEGCNPIQKKSSSLAEAFNSGYKDAINFLLRNGKSAAAKNIANSMGLIFRLDLTSFSNFFLTYRACSIFNFA